MKNITLLDGGMGQELLRRSGRKATPLWSADIMLHEPELVRDLHLDFIRSGARVITLNTYTATPHRLERAGELDNLKRLHQSAIKAAHDAVELSGIKEVQIAGCLPPLIASYHPDTTLPFQQSLDTYRQLVELQSSACDVFICETMSSVNEAKAACTAAQESKKPVWVGLSVCDDNPKQLRSGRPLNDALSELQALGPEAILLNCSHPEAINKAWPLLQKTGQKIGAYANGFLSVEPLRPGGTVNVLKVRQDLNPEQYATYAMNWAKNGASIIGGCCEIGPEHIKALHKKLSDNGFV